MYYQILYMANIYKHTVSIKISDAGIIAWNGLIKYHIQAGPVLRDKGESGMIKLYESYLTREKREKIYGKNHPNWLFD